MSLKNMFYRCAESILTPQNAICQTFMTHFRGIFFDIFCKVLSKLVEAEIIMSNFDEYVKINSKKAILF